MSSGRVLVVDDEREMSRAIEQELEERGFEVTTCDSADAAFELAMTTEHDVVVTDVRMRGMSGIDLCTRLVANRPDLPVIVMTGFGSLDTAIATLRAGAFDFLAKPFDMEELHVAIDRALAHRQLREEVRRLRREVASTRSSDELLGNSAPMVALRQLIAQVAESDATVLVTGESGSGKELVARAVHQASRRSQGPLVAINCAAMPEQLLESELFGHVRGAFTDAKTSRKGLLLEASGGTLFLDEIGEMPLGMQAKLLRALEARTVRPVGGTTEVPFDARIIAATNRDLEQSVADKTFREDLFYRINVVHIELPPLRARGNDVLLLAQHLVARCAERQGKKITSIAPAVAERLLAYGWPGNVRELHNCIERAVALARFDQLVVEDLPPKIRNYKPTQVVIAPDDPADFVTLETLEARYVQRVYDAVGRNKRLAARILGVDRTTLYRKLARYGVEPPSTPVREGPPSRQP